MRTPDEIYYAVLRQIRTEMRATADFRRTLAGKYAKAMVGARTRLLPLLQEVAGLRDIDLLLRVERAFMELELEHIAHARKNISSLNRGLRQIDAAIVMLDRVRDPDRYGDVDFYYTLSEDLVPKSDLPKDAAHKFFGSHRTRLDNVETGPLDESQIALLEARSSNMRLARQIYVELQQQALAISEVREPTAEGYRPTPATSEAYGLASEIREVTKPYLPEGELRRAA